MRNPAVPLALPLALALSLAAAAAVPAAADPSLATRFLLLAGHPTADAADSEGVLVIPGLVMPLGDRAPDGPPAEAAVREVTALASNLTRTLRLEEVEVLYTHPQRLAVGEETTLPPPSASSPVRIAVTLQGFNRELATYRVRFTDGAKTFADSVVSVPRDKRALVGGLDGEEAPYLFLVVEPAVGVQRVEEGITPPRVVEKPAPAYTAEAKAARIQGVVILQATIDERGTVERVEILKGLPLGLGEAAAETVRRWRFEPARDRAGEPIAVTYNLTVNFTLE